jgi:3-methyladenine DNA glycosylase AlkD
MNGPEVLGWLRARANPDNVAGMAWYGINPRRTLGVPLHELRRLARDHALAARLWASGIYEARLLRTIMYDLRLVTRRPRDFDSWDVCDQACQNLFRYTPHA